VEDWLKGDGADPNQRDYTGRAPLHLAVTSSTPDIVNCLVKNGARLVARLVDGRTALHLAALRGDSKIVKIIMEKSEANEAEEELKAMRRKDAKAAAKVSQQPTEENGKSDTDKNSSHDSDEDPEFINAEDDSEDGMQSVATGSFVKVGRDKDSGNGDALPRDEDEDEPDFYDVNVVSWDTPCSPLHLAIVNGHTEVVKMLCGDFGADVLLPVKLLSDYDKSPRAAILTLVLALSLPLEQAKVMAQTLLDLGATSNQADLKGITAFHYYVNNGPNTTQILLENDTAAARAALKHIVVTGNRYSPGTASSSLLTAIQNRDAITALKLLDSGAAAQIEFASWIKSAKISFENNYGFRDDPEDNMKLFKKSVDQPICVAVEAEQPSVALEILERGADPNTLTKTGAEVVQDEHQRRYRKGESVLDQVQEKLKALREYGTKKEEDSLNPPEPLKEDAYYLSSLQDGTYKHWIASTGLKSAKARHESQLKSHNERIKLGKDKAGSIEKQQAITDLISVFEDLEKALLQKGAKIFQDLHPLIIYSASNNNYKYETAKPRPFEVSFGFALGDLTEKMKELYLELFQAAWVGDIEKIKSLTLMPQGENKDEPPLQIAVRDFADLSPFSIAVLRDHLDTATAILEIARAQYVPKEKKGQERYSMNYQDSDDGSHDSDDHDASDELDIYREIVDDKFTIENIGEVSLQVKSPITPLTFFNWTAPIQRFAEFRPEVGGRISGISSTLLTYAIALDKKDLLVFLINLGAKYTARKDDDDSTPSQFYDFGASELNFVLGLGHTHLVSEILKRTGCGLPLDDFVKKSGVEVKDKPKYYQGLSIHGSKRADWAAAGRNMHVAQTGTKTSLVLIAARLASIESVEFLLSDTPVRLYSEFAKTYEDDKRLKHLSKASGGLNNAVSNWLATGSHLLLHAVVLAPCPTENKERLIKYLLQSGRQTLNAKTKDDETPLMLAYLAGDITSAKLLITVGADQSTHAHGDNLVHGALSWIRSFRTNLRKFADILDLLDAELLRELFLQRNSASHSNGATPLHHWLLSVTADNYNDKGDAFAADLLKLLLKYSQGKELQMINSAGETPLHTVISRGNLTLAKVLLDFNPELLYRENATGRTPAEVAQDMCLATKFSGPADVTHTSYNAWGNSPHNAQNIVNRDPNTFLKDTKKGDRSSAQEMWSLCKEYMEKHPQKRRLVSLPEANEVAKRLGEMSKKKKSSRGRTRDEDEEGDYEKEEENADPIVIWFKQADKWAGNDDEEEK
jgi:ankyrin repeat protein